MRTRNEAVTHAQNFEGKWTDYDGFYGAQCCDLALNYVDFLGFTPPKGNAKDWAYLLLPPGFVRTKNYPDFIPEPGDIVVWAYGDYGHIAVVLEADKSSFTTVEQNVEGNLEVGGAAQVIRHVDWDYTWFIRPPFAEKQGFKVGDYVQYEGYVYATSEGNGKGQYVEGVFRITYTANSSYGLHLADKGWVKPESCSLAEKKSEKPTTPADFIKAIKPAALKAWKVYKILPSLTIAQAALESGWGTSELATGANALFAVKAHSNWQGKTYTIETWEERTDGQIETIQAAFRAYDSWSDSVEDRCKYMTSATLSDGSLRYRKVLGEANFEKACAELGLSGYATASDYGDVLIDIIKDFHLTDLDKEALLGEITKNEKYSKELLEKFDELIELIRREKDYE